MHKQEPLKWDQSKTSAPEFFREKRRRRKLDNIIKWNENTIQGETAKSVKGCSYKKHWERGARYYVNIKAIGTGGKINKAQM